MSCICTKLVSLVHIVHSPRSIVFYYQSGHKQCSFLRACRCVKPHLWHLCLNYHSLFTDSCTWMLYWLQKHKIWIPNKNLMNCIIICVFQESNSLNQTKSAIFKQEFVLAGATIMVVLAHRLNCSIKGWIFMYLTCGPKHHLL